MAVQTQVLVPALKLQFDFHFDETRRLLEVARRLPEEHFLANNQDRFNGIQHIFAHIMGADRFWRSVISGELLSEHESMNDTHIDGLIELVAAERVSWDRLFVLLDDKRLIERVEHTLPFGTFSFTIGQAMQHVILHGHQHHGEIAHLLTEAGHSPGDVDFFDYVAERGS